MMDYPPDPIATYNERTKLTASTINALGIGLVGFAVLRPAAEDVATLELTAVVWTFIGLALHGVARHLLGYLRREPDDELV